jgi:CRP-like cAMP-binding protein
MGVCSSTQDSPFQSHPSLPFSLVMEGTHLKDFARFGDLFKVRKFKSGAQVCAQGAPLDIFYVINSGSCEYWIDEKNDSGGIQKKSIGIKGPGNCIGSVRDSCTQYVYSATARGATSCYEIMNPRETLAKLFDSNGELKSRLYPYLGNEGQVLSKTALFRGFTRKEMDKIAVLMHIKVLQPEDVLFQEGDMGNSMYVIAHGECDVRAGLGDNERLLSVLGEGDFVGETALVMEMPRTATVLSKKGAVVLELDTPGYEEARRRGMCHLQSAVKERVVNSFRKYKVPFFEAIPQDKYSILSDLCEIQVFQPGDWVCAQGDPGLEFFIIAHGTMEFFKHEDWDPNSGMFPHHPHISLLNITSIAP